MNLLKNTVIYVATFGQLFPLTEINNHCRFSRWKSLCLQTVLKQISDCVSVLSISVHEPITKRILKCMCVAWVVAHEGDLS